MNLSERLRVLADYIPMEGNFADIGTDHGYIPIYLVKNNFKGNIIACDINKGPLEIAKKNFEKEGVLDRIETRISDGLKSIEKGEVETICIAGMGGILISEILSEDMEKTKGIKRFLLQPRNAQDKLRKWLLENEFLIEDESIVKEGKYYWEILSVVNGKEEIFDEVYLHIGKKAVENKDKYLIPFLDSKINVQSQIIMNTVNSSSKEAHDAFCKARELKSKLEEVKAIVNK